MRVEGRYDSESHAKLALRRWRGLYGDPEVDPEDRFFRVRHMPQNGSGGPLVNFAENYPWAVVSLTDREEADVCDEQGEIKA